MNTDLLDSGERLELQRRRANLTQQEMADLLGEPVSRYRRAEKKPDPEYSSTEIVDLSDAEACWLARRRSGLTLNEVAETSGFHRQWIHNVERGHSKNSSVLLAWWDSQE